MNILFITQLFPFKRGDQYTSGPLREFIEEWGGMGHRVKVIRPHYGYEKEAFPDQPEFKIGKNIDVEFIKPLRIPLLKLNYYSLSKVIHELPFHPDVVICHLYNSYFLFYRLARQLNVPLIIGIHMSDIRISKNRFHYWRQKQIFKHANGFAVRSHEILRKLKNRFPEFKDKAFLALSGIPDRYVGLNPKNVNEGDKIRIISVGSLIKRKQIDKVLMALSALDSVNWDYTIIGSGKEYDRLRHLSVSLGIQQRVNFKGHMERDQVIEEMLDAQIFILPSYMETLGLVYLEAMACGCITIGSRNEGIDGIIKDGVNGLLCDPYDMDSIREKLTQAFHQSEKERAEMRDKALDTVSDFTLKKKAEAYLDHIKGFLAP
jgi:glycosyltransferase involved in cell wall biosynthesis